MENHLRNSGAVIAGFLLLFMPLSASAQTITPDTFAHPAQTVPEIPLSVGGFGMTDIEKLAQQLQLQVAKLLMQAQQIQLARMSASAGATFEPAAGAGKPDPLKSSMGSVKGASTVNCPGFTRTLRFGARGEDVQALQSFLYHQGFLTHEDVTAYYGYLTEAAVQSFQLKHGILTGGDPTTNGYGVAGATTQKAVFAICSNSIE